MIRRGLQFACLWMFLLGAAPLSAQIDYQYYPQYVTLSGFEILAWNGIYTRGLFVDGAIEYYQYPADTGSLFMRVSFRPADGLVIVALWSGGTTLTQKTYSGNQPLPEIMTGFSVGGGVAMTTTPDEYQQAFPDWASAGARIPLGFTFGMSVWAVCVAAAISLKWVRDLASAAS